MMLEKNIPRIPFLHKGDVTRNLVYTLGEHLTPFSFYCDDSYF